MIVVVLIGGTVVTLVVVLVGGAVVTLVGISAMVFVAKFLLS